MTSRIFISAWALTLGSWFFVATWAFVGFVAAPLPALAHDGETHGQMAVTNIWARATPAGARVAAAYFTVESADDDVLERVETPIAGRAEIHKTTQDTNGALNMRALPSGLDLPAKVEVTLAPGGTHIMLMEVENGLTEGYEFPLTLWFKKAGKRTVRASIKAISHMPGLDGSGAPMHHGQH